MTVRVGQLPGRRQLALDDVITQSFLTEGGDDAHELVVTFGANFSLLSYNCANEVSGSNSSAAGSAVVASAVGAGWGCQPQPRLLAVLRGFL